MKDPNYQGVVTQAYNFITQQAKVSELPKVQGQPGYRMCNRLASGT